MPLSISYAIWSGKQDMYCPCCSDNLQNGVYLTSIGLSHSCMHSIVWVMLITSWVIIVTAHTYMCMCCVFSVPRLHSHVGSLHTSHHIDDGKHVHDEPLLLVGQQENNSTISRAGVSWPHSFTPPHMAS